VQVNRNRSDTVGRESGERFRMNFDGDSGYVVVQSVEHAGANETHCSLGFRGTDFRIAT